MSAAPDSNRPATFDFEEIADDLPDGVAVCDSDGVILFANLPLAELLGYRPAELVGLPVETLVPERLRDQHVLERRRYLSSPARRPMGLGLDIVARHRSGREIPVEIGISRVADDPARLIAVVRDMTDSIAAERARRTEAGLYQTILETSNDLVLVVTDELRVVFANSRAIEAFQSEDVPLVGSRLPVGADPVLGALRTMLECREPGATAEQDLLLHGADEHEIWVHVRAWPLSGATGAAIGSVVSIADVTARKRAEEARGRLEADLRETQKMTALGRLAAGVAHDFNNILQVIGGVADIAREAPPGEDLREALTTIIDAVRQGTDLSAQLLAFGAPASVEAQGADVVQVMERLLPFLGRLVRGGVDIEFEGVDEPLPIGLSGSEVEQMVMNLVLNAEEAIVGDGTVTLRALRAQESFVGHARNAVDVARIVVADTGPGIADEVLPRLFEPHFTTKAKGTGLGLATVYRLVTGAGGRMVARNRTSCGAEIVVTIPLLASEPASA